MSYRFANKVDYSDDIHELLKNEISIENGINDESSFYTNNYVLLDSFLKLETSTTEKGEYKWLLNTQGVGTSESIGVIELMDYVVEVQIGPFFLPVLEDVDYINIDFISHSDVTLVQNNTTPGINLPPTLIRNGTSSGQYPSTVLKSDSDNYVLPWVNNPYTQIPYFNRITIQLVEANLQSYVNMNNTRFNFEFEAQHNHGLSVNPNFIEAKPINGDGWDIFHFNTPLRQLLTITLLFRNPDYPINFEPDIMYRSVINLSFDIFSGDGYNVIITTQYTHKLKAGDRVFLRNFTPKDLLGNVNANFPIHIKNYINRNDGHVINIVPGTAFFPADPSVDINGSAFGLDPSLKILLPLDTNTSTSFPGLVDVLISKRRLRIPLKIKCLKNNT